MTFRLWLSAAVLTLVLGTTLSAQRIVKTQFAAGGVAFFGDPMDPPLGGWYADAMQECAGVGVNRYWGKR
jgi:hypothetical protein